MSKINWLIILLGGVLSVGFLSSCSKGDGEEDIVISSGEPNDPSNPGNNEPPTTGTSKKPDANKFYVYAKIKQNAQIYTHKKIGTPTDDAQWEQKCEIDLDDTNAANRNLDCLVEVHEGDLHYLGASLEYNVPKHYKCAYLAYRPYFFERYHISQGPATFTENRDADGELISVTGSPDVTITDGAARCVYDYRNNKGPNCCLGDYVKTVITATVGTTTEKGTWSDNIAGCFSGPGTKILKPNEYGIPMTQILSFDQSSGTTTDSGRNETLLLEAPNNGTQLFSTNLYLSNYLEDAAAVPACMSDSIFSSRYYNFVCLDNSYEVYAAIRIQVRDWNQKTELAKKANGDANTSGAETDFPDYDWADFDDWKDWIDAANDDYPGLGL